MNIVIRSVTIRRNLSAEVCRNYTSPTTARMSEPRTGASCRAVVEISECNYYRPQHLDSRPVTERITIFMGSQSIQPWKPLLTYFRAHSVRMAGYLSLISR